MLGKVPKGRSNERPSKKGGKMNIPTIQTVGFSSILFIHRRNEQDFEC